MAIGKLIHVIVSAITVDRHQDSSYL